MKIKWIGNSTVEITRGNYITDDGQDTIRLTEPLTIDLTDSGPGGLDKGCRENDSCSVFPNKP
jgi:hypothetical protein